MTMNHQALAFFRHYVEMILVMLVGMFVLGGALLAAATVLGFGRTELEAEAPGLLLAGMGFSMTAPMVWWMHRRGHSWPANRAMATAMIAPTAATIVLLAMGTVTDLHSLFMIEHVAMGPAMLVAMVPFRGEFTHAHTEVAA
jgi:hypothetical protein